MIQLEQVMYRRSVLATSIAAGAFGFVLTVGVVAVRATDRWFGPADGARP